jgi:hypothetical protein
MKQGRLWGWRFGPAQLCALALVLQLPGASLAAEPPVDLNIPLGRIGIFAEQESQAMTDLEIEDEEPSSSHAIYGRIFMAIWTHNVNAMRVCEDKLLPRKICRTAQFRPRWLTPPGKRMYSFKRLTHMADQAQGAMTPFWSALCAEAAKRKGEETLTYCPME